MSLTSPSTPEQRRLPKSSLETGLELGRRAMWGDTSLQFSERTKFSLHDALQQQVEALQELTSDRPDSAGKRIVDSLARQLSSQLGSTKDKAIVQASIPLTSWEHMGQAADVLTRGQLTDRAGFLNFMYQPRVREGLHPGGFFAYEVNRDAVMRIPLVTDRQQAPSARLAELQRAVATTIHMPALVEGQEQQHLILPLSDHAVATFGMNRVGPGRPEAMLPTRLAITVASPFTVQPERA